MKKYFVVETGEVIEFGEPIVVSMEKDIEKGLITVQKQHFLSEENVDLLLALGVIEERDDEEEENDDLLDFEDEEGCPLAARLQELEEKQAAMDELLNNQTAILNKMLKTMEQMEAQMEKSAKKPSKK